MAKEAKKLVKKETTGPVVAFQDMEKWVEDAFRRPFSFFSHPMMRLSQNVEIVPPIDILENNGDIVVKAELPGVKKEDIDITLTDGTITIIGEKKKEEEVKKKEYYRYESSYGSFCFCHTFSLPSEVQTDKAQTKMKDGVLEIRIPKKDRGSKEERSESKSRVTI